VHKLPILPNRLLGTPMANSKKASARLYGNTAAPRNSQAALESVLRAAPAGIGLTINRVFYQVNEHLCQMLGYTRDELLGRETRLVYVGDGEHERVGGAVRREAATRSAGATETKWKRKDGQVLDVLLNWALIVPGDPSRGVTFVALDISQRKQAEEERRQLEARVLHAQKLESLGVLAGGIAHDFNNLLMAILGNLELAASQLSPASPAHPYLRSMETASRRAAGLCQQMLAYSGKGRFVIEALSLNEVVREMMHILEVSVSKRAAVRYDLAAELPAMEADANQIRQVLMNLIINASEALGEGQGVISIRTGALHCTVPYLAGTYVAESLPEGLYVYAEVADTGCGMTPEVKQRMFEPFFTTKFSGRGLGMAAVLGILRGHKGAIEVYSEVGKGTTIKVLFPASGKAAAEDGQAQPVAEWRGSGTVLLVDDDQAILVLVADMLKRIGFSVLTATDGCSALEAYRAHRSEIACVVLDLTMPDFDGAETFRELRQLDPKARVIITSGYDEQEVAQRFAGKGLAAFMQKPYQTATLRTKLREVLEQN